MKKIMPLFAFLLVLDLGIKYLVSNTMTIGESITIIPNFFYIHYVENTGAAFSMFQSGTFFLIFISTVVLFLVFTSAMRTINPSWSVVITYAALLAGISGNLYDRIFNGAVIDYLSFIIFNYKFPVFNLADTFIVLAVIALVIYEIRRKGVKEDVV